MFCQLAPGEQGDVVKLAGKAAENGFIVAGPEMYSVESASWKRYAIASYIRHIHYSNNSIKCLKAWRGPPYSHGGTGKKGFKSDMRLRDSGT